jgi:hypothetical protein
VEEEIEPDLNIATVGHVEKVFKKPNFARSFYFLRGFHWNVQCPSSER